MPNVSADGVRLHYDEAGDGAECVFFLHDLGMNRIMFEEQMVALRTKFRCVAFDFRGHGLSEHTFGGYDVDTLYRDTLALMKNLQCGPAHIVAAGTGCLVGLKLGSRRRSAVRSLTLIGASDSMPHPSRTRLRLLSIALSILGSPRLARAWMRFTFGPSYLRDPSHAEELARWEECLASNRTRSWSRAMRGVSRASSMVHEIEKVTAPVLLVHGLEDCTTPVAAVDALAARLPRATVLQVPQAGHSVSIEQPDRLSAALCTFLGDATAMHS